MSALCFPTKPPLAPVATSIVAIDLDGVSRNLITYPKMKTNPPLQRIAAFSLVEVTFALGVAAFCLLVLLGLLPTGLKTQQSSIQQTTANAIISTIWSDLRADLILPPGLYRHLEEDSGYNLHGHWAGMQQPDTLYFTQDGRWIQTGGSRPPDAVFRAKITYNPVPPTGNTSVANIVVSWPAAVDPATGVPAGSVTCLIAVNR
jgi:uncharacterized protein (TIGR02598 family)